MMRRDDSLQLDITSVGPQCAAARMASGVEVTLRLPTESVKLLIPRTSVTISQYSVSQQGGDLTIVLNPCDKGICHLHPSTKRGECQTAELFAGLGGWTYAARKMGKEPIVLVKRDSLTAATCAKAMNYPVLSARQAIDLALQGDQSPCIIQDDVANPVTWMLLGLRNVAYVLASPPCPPWSGAGANQGLQCDDGKIFLLMIKQAALVKIQMLICENVAGINRHANFDVIIAEAAMHGHKLVLAGVHDSSILHPVRRDRWLGTFVDASISMSSDDLRTANGKWFDFGQKWG